MTDRGRTSGRLSSDERRQEITARARKNRHFSIQEKGNAARQDPTNKTNKWLGGGGKKGKKRERKVGDSYLLVRISVTPR